MTLKRWNVAVIKIDIKQFIYDRVWFGYGRGAVYKWYDEDEGGKWVWEWIKL